MKHRLGGLSLTIDEEQQQVAATAPRPAGEVTSPAPTMGAIKKGRSSRSYLVTDQGATLVSRSSDTSPTHGSVGYPEAIGYTRQRKPSRGTQFNTPERSLNNSIGSNRNTPSSLSSSTRSASSPIQSDTISNPANSTAVVEALNKGNIGYLATAIGLRATLVEFCVRQKRDVVRKILETNPELSVAPEEIIPAPGNPISSNSTRCLTEDEYKDACRTLIASRFEMEVADAFELRDVRRLESLYQGTLSVGVLEAARRGEHSLAKSLCLTLYRQNPVYLNAGFQSMSGEAPATQEILRKLHEEVGVIVRSEKEKREGVSCLVM